MFPFGSNRKATTSLLEVLVCQAMVPLAWERTRFPSDWRANVAFSPTGFPLLASQTHRKSCSERVRPIRRARVKELGVVL
ncbi:Epidermis-specific secreted glycoprotein EP1 [Senna tora]|uniref:Epidermis-specific secreted glycoprotein EP1 n=1 Tax=Senna tora TaxID=362788 RepID=A0A834X1L3_9FABA|nr:Epidermis-specific secreted glycoprotein EP1 [Senna tora]